MFRGNNQGLEKGTIELLDKLIRKI